MVYVVTEIKNKELMRKYYKAKLNSLANDSDANARHTVKQFIFVLIKLNELSINVKKIQISIKCLSYK